MCTGHTGSCKSNYHTTKTTTTPYQLDTVSRAYKNEELSETKHFVWCISFLIYMLTLYDKVVMETVGTDTFHTKVTTKNKEWKIQDKVTTI